MRISFGNPMLLLDVEVNLLLEHERLWFWDER
jgi:hypothetical protein